MLELSGSMKPAAGLTLAVCAVQRSGSSGTIRVSLSRVSPAGPLISPHRMYAVRWPSEIAASEDMRASPARRHGLDLGSRPLPDT